MRARPANKTMGATRTRSATPHRRERQAGDAALSFAELHAAGIAFPAAVVSELELNGYVILPVYEHGRPVGVRLLEPEPKVTSSAPAGAGHTDSQPG